MIEKLFYFLHTMLKTLTAIARDIKGAFYLRDLKRQFRSFEGSTVYREFERNYKKHPNKTCIRYEEETWTFKDLYQYSNRVATLFKKKFQLKKGDCVALFMENKPEYVGIWLGLSKLGVITALVNTNLRKNALLHSIKVSKASAVVFGSSLEEAIADISNDLDKNLPIMIEGKPATSTKSIYLDELLEQDNEIVEPDEKLGSNDTILYIYTSGTTGLPKPAIMKQSRYHAGAVTFYSAASLDANDVIFVTLPIYHSNGGVIGIGAALINGNTVVLRKKFSASTFWSDCIKYNCTAFIYVGEICRFLVNQPKSALDRNHPVRKAIGNGLRANVWKEFSKRFGIKCFEFYSASEANCTIVNLNGKVGSCGFFALLAKYLPVYQVYLIRVDENNKPMRDENGFCIKCEAGQPGVLVGIIGKSPEKAYHGYANSDEASKTKVVDNVFKSGQSAFYSGDLMMHDSLGYIYFCDRLGDTFRWRGENVSTIEVENAISRRVDSREVVVYGVEIPGQEGRAGMAAISCKPQDINLKDLSENIRNDLPAYARPVFLRFVNEFEHTGTFKATKIKLSQDAYNIEKISEDMFYFDLKSNSYIKLTEQVYQDILDQKLRL